MFIFLFSKSNWNILNFRTNLILSLKKKNFKIYSFSEKDNYSKKLENLVSKSINISFKNRRIAILNDIFNLIKISYFCFKVKPKYFISFNIKPIILSGIISFFFNTKNIITITGLGTAFDSNTNRFITKIAILLYSICINYKDHIIFQNKHDLDFFKKNKIISNKNNYHIFPGSGVNIEYFTYKKLNNNQKYQFTYIGRLLTSKGIDYFLKTIELYFLDKSDIEFNVLGEFEKKDDFNYILFKKLLNQKKLKHYNHRDDIREIIYKSDCVVLPSYREGTSKVLLEAMSCGRPIITSNVPGCNYLVNNNKNGFLCNINNPYSLKNKIIEYQALNSEIKKKMSINCRKFVELKFDEKLVIKSYYNIIKKLDEN